MNWKVPFFDLQLENEEKEAVRAVLDSNWITAGPGIAEFETEFSAEIGADVIAVAVSTGTAALHLSLLALDIGSGDEVVVPSLTFVACANVIQYVGAIPVFADITSPDNWNISVADVERKISSRTKAIMVVHYGGYPCDIAGFLELALRYDLKIIEDCSHAPLARHVEGPVGTFGATGCFSFYSNKNLTTGEGGMVVTQDVEVAERLKILRSHGITSSTYQRFKENAYGYDVVELGFNYRLDEIRAAIGIQQLRKLRKKNRIRHKLVSKYRALLAEKLPQVRVPFANYSGEASYHIFPVLVPVEIRRRDAIIKAMGGAGIQCSMHYRPIHTFTAYEGFVADVPVTEAIADSIITLPLFPGLTDDQMDLVVCSLKQCLMRYVSA